MLCVTLKLPKNNYQDFEDDVLCEVDLTGLHNYYDYQSDEEGAHCKNFLDLDKVLTKPRDEVGTKFTWRPLGFR